MTLETAVNSPHVEYIFDHLTANSDQTLLAILITKDFHRDGYTFFTDTNAAQQVGYISLQAGSTIKPHTHNYIPRQIPYTNETLIIRAGRMYVAIYNNDQILIASRILKAGDVIVLLQGGHGFEVIEDVELYEIKQGPYLGDKDKKRFTPMTLPAESPPTPSPDPTSKT